MTKNEKIGTGIAAAAIILFGIAIALKLRKKGGEASSDTGGGGGGGGGGSDIGESKLGANTPGRLDPTIQPVLHVNVTPVQSTGGGLTRPSSTTTSTTTTGSNLGSKTTTTGSLAPQGGFVSLSGSAPTVTPRTTTSGTKTQTKPKWGATSGTVAPRLEPTMKTA